MPEATSTVRDFAIAPTTDGVTAPLGFRSAALHCGIKAKAGALDLTVLAADGNASAAGIFRTNVRGSKGPGGPSALARPSC